VDEAKLMRVAEVIERATRMQMQLVDDLVDVSRIVAGKLKVELGGGGSVRRHQGGPRRGQRTGPA
jgi:signal transduction histidine kinase